ncbi:hypothetical protein PVAP13_9NG777977 [Panicum virgatum]|uniref:Uncharacterized protein n=1 Tax=Panicum virgatum TaxID=38727 RepID=A0A8T0N4V0_PANVG|nr:hypothetical protein PVAP13_9NG777977 [Panicum virgatum]
MQTNPWNPCRPKPPASDDGGRRRKPRAIGQPELHRQQAFSRTAVDARHLGRDKANAEEPSVGDAPQALVTVKADSPVPTNAAAEPESAAPLSCLPHNPKLPLHHETKGQRAHLTTSRCPWTPVQGIHTGSPSSMRPSTAPERNAIETGESTGGRYSLMTTPPPPRRRRRKPNPRNPRT